MAQESDGLFWQDLAEDLKDPEFLRGYITEAVKIAAIDSVVNELDEAREAAGLSKAELARAVRMNPSFVRRILTSECVNPNLGTVAELAAALGMRVALVPLQAQERREITKPLLAGHAADVRALVEHVSQVHRRTGRPKAAVA